MESSPLRRHTDGSVTATWWIIAFSLLAAAPSAHSATLLSLSVAADVVTGKGYGTDASEKPREHPTLLGVHFADSLVSRDLKFDNINDSLSFDIGGVSLLESSKRNGILGNERDDLGVAWTFDFTAGDTRVQTELHAVVSAKAGRISDARVDYSLAWPAAEVLFGDGWRLGISLNDLEFTQRGHQIQRATITLLGFPPPPIRESPTPSAVVPAPGSIALLALGLAGIGAVRRRGQGG